MGFCTPFIIESWSFSVRGALEVVDDALERQSPEALLEALQDPALALRGVKRDFVDWYLEQLSLDREHKAQVRLYLFRATCPVCWWGPRGPLTQVSLLYSASAAYILKQLNHPRA